MFKGRFQILILPVLCFLFIVVSFLMNEWFCASMPRHQLLQLPAMLSLGIVSAVSFSKLSISDSAWGIAILVIIMSSLAFWMLPHSIDVAVINPWVNRVMHLNMFAAGFFLTMVLRGIIFEIKIVFFWMVSAMVLATGITLKSFDILLCSSFTIAQQNETGYYLLLVGFTFAVMTMIIFFRGLGAKKQEAKG